MIGTNVYFLLGCPCSGKTTVGRLLEKRFGMYYFSGDERRFDYYKLAERQKHPYMTKDASDFWSWSLDEMIEWEKGVISEQTPYILADLDKLAEKGKPILFEGMLDLDLVSKNALPEQVAYLSVDKLTCERVFFEREDHRGMVDNIMSTPGIGEAEKQRRISIRRKAAIEAFCEDAAAYGIRAFRREDTGSAEEMAEKVARYFNLLYA